MGFLPRYNKIQRSQFPLNLCCWHRAETLKLCITAVIYGNCSYQLIKAHLSEEVVPAVPLSLQVTSVEKLKINKLIFFWDRHFCASTKEATAAISDTQGNTYSVSYIPIIELQFWLLLEWRRKLQKCPAVDWNGGRSSEGQTCFRSSWNCNSWRDPQYFIPLRRKIVQYL